MCAKPDQPEQRDRAMARLLAEALQPAASSPAAGSAAGRAACPDAELVAAYADQGLAGGPGKGPLENDERLELESHFAACERCQKILAALGAGLEAPVGESVAALPAPASPATPRPAARPPQRWLWWLTPAFGAAAAALLWMALRPAAPQPVQTAADYSRAAEPESRALNAPTARSRQAETPPAAAPRRDAQALDRLSKAEPGAKETGEGTRDKAFAQLAAPSAKSDAAAPAAPGARSEIAAAAVPPQAAVVQGTVAPAPAPPARNQAAAAGNESADGRPLRARTTATLGGALSQQSVAELPQNGGSVAQGGLYTFASPDGSVLWRLGAAGLIERSTDRGQTWQQQASGVTADLLAGSAASNDVAWVVGREGVILRTANGQQWQRIAPPAGATGDWATIVVRSATSATVVGAVRRFSTEDGGLTWTEQR